MKFFLGVPLFFLITALFNPTLNADTEPKYAFLSAAPAEVARAFCHNPASPSEIEMKQWLHEFSQSISQRIDLKINGVDFKDENPELIRLFDQLTSYRGESLELSTQRFQTTCHKVQCALDEIFGPSLSLRLLYMLARYHFNGSELVDPETVRWETSELDSVLWALSDYPTSVLPIRVLAPLTHFKHDPNLKLIKGQKYETSDAHISVYDFWDTRDPLEKIYFISHEVGHRLDNQDFDGISFEKDWSNFSWNKFEIINSEMFVSQYAQENKPEDFAESIAAFHYNPSHFEKSADKFNFLKSVIFDNLDFKSEENCSNQQTFSVKTRATSERKLLLDLQRNKIPQDWVKAAQKYCGEEIVWALSQDRFVEEFPEEISMCLARGLIASASADELSSGPYYDLRKALFRIRPQEDFPELVKNERFIQIQRSVIKTLRVSFESAMKLRLVSTKEGSYKSLAATSEDPCRKWSEAMAYYLDAANFEENFGNIDTGTIFTWTHKPEVNHLAIAACNLTQGQVNLKNLRKAIERLLPI